MTRSISMAGKSYPIHTISYSVSTLIMPLPILLLWASKRNRDGLGEIDARYPDIDVTPAATSFLRIDETKPFYDCAIEAIVAQPTRSVTYVVLGPLTNLATLVRRAPEVCRERLGRVVIMGGALDVPGNDTAVAECT